MQESAKGSGPQGEWTELDEKFHKLATTTLDHELRAEIMASAECPAWLLAGTLEHDTFSNVILAAALNPSSPEESVKKSLQRFPELDTEYFWDLRQSRIKAHAALSVHKTEEEAIRNVASGNRDTVIMNHILTREGAEIKSKRGKNPARSWDPTDRYRIAMIMAPAWGVLFPSYGIAKLTAMMRIKGYAVKVYDANVEASHFLQEKHGIDYWDHGRYFVWTTKSNFDSMILPDLAPLLQGIVKEIVESEVKVVGFTMYQTNALAVLYMAKLLRKIVPDICIMVGGPEATMSGKWWFEAQGPVFNYIFVGEAEEQLLYLLENLPATLPYNRTIGTVDSRLPLENYPYADYTDYDLNLYRVRGINIETSRGCVAKCSFCAETQFWKYRNITIQRVVDEIEYQIQKNNTRRVWFVDSLINGNLKMFSELLDILLEKKLNIEWNSYSRCDGRMDLSFFRRIKESGCTLLSFGIEAGSQKVLDDMHKRVKVWEIEANMRDCHAAGIYVHSSWLQAFPTETPLDFLHNIQMMYNCRKWINSISPGMGAGITPNSDLDRNWQIYDIQWNPDRKGAAEDRFLGDWWTSGYKNTVLHRFLRVKLVNIWLQMMSDHLPENIIENSTVYPDLRSFYTLKFKKPTGTPGLVQDNYLDFNYVCEGTTYEGLIAQEYLAFMYGLWQVFGEVTWTFNCEPEMDRKNFGDFLTRVYWCDVTIKIDTQGNYEVLGSHRLEHRDPRGENMLLDRTSLTGDVDYVKERERKDMSFQREFKLKGNFGSWKSAQSQVALTIHPQYRQNTIVEEKENV
jgi:hypothetical protein